MAGRAISLLASQSLGAVLVYSLLSIPPVIPKLLIKARCVCQRRESDGKRSCRHLPDDLCDSPRLLLSIPGSSQGLLCSELQQGFRNGKGASVSASPFSALTCKVQMY